MKEYVMKFRRIKLKLYRRSANPVCVCLGRAHPKIFILSRFAEVTSIVCFQFTPDQIGSIFGYNLNGLLLVCTATICKTNIFRTSVIFFKSLRRIGHHRYWFLKFYWRILTSCLFCFIFFLWSTEITFKAIKTSSFINRTNVSFQLSRGVLKHIAEYTTLMFIGD